MRHAVVVLLVLLRCALPAAAATINAVSCSDSDIQTAINSSSHGDTVVIPNGSCTWTTGIGFSGKKVILRGESKAGVRITKPSGNYAVAIAEDIDWTGQRVTNLTAITRSDGYSFFALRGRNWRLDTMDVENLSGASLSEFANAIGPLTFETTGPAGLIHDVHTVNVRIWVGVAIPDVPANAGYPWSSPLALGSLNQTIIEDSSVTHTAGFPDGLDGNYGARWTLRYSTISGTSIDCHSVQANNRACRSWEIYKNTFTSPHAYFTPIFMRGGTGTIVNNTIAGSYSGKTINLDAVRASDDRTGASGPLCADGTYTCLGAPPQWTVTSPAYGDGVVPGDFSDNLWDSKNHASPPTGCAIRDQIGCGGDVSRWTSGSPYPKQYTVPAYFVGNRSDGSITSVNVSQVASQLRIQANRDYFNEVAGFNGTAGCGKGTKAQMLAITPVSGSRVCFLVEDEGTWNKRFPSENFRIYVETGGAWAFDPANNLGWEPPEYPHPLRGASNPTSGPSLRGLGIGFPR